MQEPLVDLVPPVQHSPRPRATGLHPLKGTILQKGVGRRDNANRREEKALSRRSGGGGGSSACLGGQHTKVSPLMSMPALSRTVHIPKAVTVPLRSRSYSWNAACSRWKSAGDTPKTRVTAVACSGPAGLCSGRWGGPGESSEGRAMFPLNPRSNPSPSRLGQTCNPA